MAAAVRLRSDFDGVELRRLARASRNAKQVRRLLALAAIYEGANRSEAARIGGVTLQIVRDWVVRFNGDGPAGLTDFSIDYTLWLNLLALTVAADLFIQTAGTRWITTRTTGHQQDAAE